MNIKKVTLIVKGNLTVKGGMAICDATCAVDLADLDKVNYDRDGQPYVWDASEAFIAEGDVVVSGYAHSDGEVVVTGEIISY